MKIYEVLDKALVGALSVPQAADIAGIPIRSVLRWVRCRKAGLPTRYDRRPPRTGKKVLTTQMHYALKLYEDGYRGLSADAFARALRRDHGIAMSAQALREMLRGEGLLAPRRAARRPRLVRAPERTGEVQSSGDPPSPIAMVPVDIEIVRRLQHVNGTVEVVMSRARDATVQWRQRRQTTEAVLQSFQLLARELERAVGEIRLIAGEGGE